MAAANTDKWRKGAAQWTGNIGSAGVTDGTVTTIPLVSASGLPTDTAVMITINRVDANGDATNNYEGVIGVVSGNNITDCVRGAEGTAQGWTAGTVVEVLHTAKNLNDLVDGLLVEHNQDGTHKSELVTTLKATGEEIDTGTEDAKIVTPKAIADASVLAKLAGAQTFTGAKTFEAVSTFRKSTKPASKADTDGATITFDMDEANYHTVTLGGNRTLAVTNVSVGQSFIIRLKQDATGGRTVTWWEGISWAGGEAPSLTTDPNNADVFGFTCTSSGNYDGFVVGQSL